MIPAGEMVLDAKARMEAERLRLDVEIDIVAKSLPGLRAEFIIVGLRRTEETKAHGRYVSIGRADGERADPSAKSGDRRRAMLVASVRPHPLGGDGYVQDRAGHGFHRPGDQTAAPLPSSAGTPWPRCPQT